MDPVPLTMVFAPSLKCLTSDQYCDPFSMVDLRWYLKIEGGLQEMTVQFE